MNHLYPRTSRRPRPVSTFAQRGRMTALMAGIALLRLLPEGLVYRAAYAAGAGLSLVMNDRRRLVRDNVRQLCSGLVARGLASDRIARASADDRRLERMVRAVFGHWTVAYAEAALTMGYTGDELRDRVRMDDAAATAAAMGLTATDEAESGGGRIYISPHFGCVELAARYAVEVGGLRLTAPMETVSDPALQAYLEKNRGAGGVTLIPIRGAATTLRAALEHGEAVALVADRAIGGSGIPVDLLGASVRLPLGPAVLAIESNVPVFVVGVRRIGWGLWASRVERLEPVAPGPLRIRVHAQLAAQARAFERLIADAPEQWWTLLFPIWQRGPVH